MKGSIFGSRHLTGLIATAFVVLMNVACQAYGHGDTHQKLKNLSQAILEQPQSAELYLQRGRVHTQHGEWDKAIADYERVERLDPCTEHLDLLFGKALRGAERYEEAISWLDRYIVKHPENASAFLARGRAHAAAQDVDSASGDFAKVAELAPNPDACVEWAMLLVRTNRADEAIQRLEEGCKTLGPLISLRVKMIDIEISRKNYDAALDRIDAILDGAPRKERWFARKGDVLTKAGQPAAAAEAYSKALVALRRLPSKYRYSAAMQSLEKSLQQKLGEEINGVNPP